MKFYSHKSPSASFIMLFSVLLLLSKNSVIVLIPYFFCNHSIILHPKQWIIQIFTLLECSQEDIDGMVNSTYIFDTLEETSL